MDCLLLLQQVLVVCFTIVFFWKLIKHMWSFVNVEKEPIIVLVTEATGPIGYAIVPMIANGAMLGNDQPIILHLLDKKSSSDALKDLKMELVDSAFPLLKGIVATTDMVEACQDVNVVVMIGGSLGEEGMDKKDVVSKNFRVFKDRALALEEHAAENCKVLVIGNEANTNALILKEFAPSIPSKNVTSLARVEQNRAIGQISERLNVHVSDVKNVIIWGNINNSHTHYVDLNHAFVNVCSGQKRLTQLVNDDNWLKLMELITDNINVETRNQSRAFSIASSACNHIRDWFLGTPKGTWVSMGVCSEGSYGIEAGIIYSFPVTCDKGEWSIVQGLKIDDLSRAKMDKSAKELIEEKSLAYSCLDS